MPSPAELAQVYRDTQAKVQDDVAYKNLFDIARSNLGKMKVSAAQGNTAATDTDTVCIVTLQMQDCLVAAYDLTQKYASTVAVLNFANSHTPGGSVLRGSKAQEESIFRRTTCCRSDDTVNLDQHGDYPRHMSDRLNGMNTAAGLYTRPSVCWRGPEHSLPVPCEELPDGEIFEFTELRGAALYIADKKDGSLQQQQSSPATLNNMSRRIVLQFETLKKANVKHAVLGAFGCGEFNNDPAIVARIYRDCIAQYQKDFVEIVFAILDKPTSPCVTAFETCMHSKMGSSFSAGDLHSSASPDEGGGGSPTDLDKVDATPYTHKPQHTLHCSLFYMSAQQPQKTEAEMACSDGTTETDVSTHYIYPCWVPMHHLFNTAETTQTPFLWATEFDIRRSPVYLSFDEPRVCIHGKVYASAVYYYNLLKAHYMHSAHGHSRKLWHSKRVKVMQTAVQARFKDPYLRNLLVQTHPHALKCVRHELSAVSMPSFWAHSPTHGGQDMLGKIVLQLRTDLLEAYRRAPHASTHSSRLSCAAPSHSGSTTATDYGSTRSTISYDPDKMYYSESELND